MNNIALPKEVKFTQSTEKNKAMATIEPCYPGYGITLGNALRRVLLSSLPGAAVVGVKIKDADHEFMALPHIKEDVLEIILNLKKLRLKIYTDEIVKLELDVHGEKKVKASDIKSNSQAEVVNPGLVLADITDMSGNLNMEIYVAPGLGYETVESREAKDKEKEIGYIDIDSVFSPVIGVGIRMENVRVGKMTNWDRLILDITTDGTITPEEAFAQADKILIEQFKALTKEEKEEKKKIKKKEKEEKKEEKQEEKEEVIEEEKSKK